MIDNTVSSDELPGWLQDYVNAPAPTPAPQPTPGEQSNFVASGLATGYHQAVGALGSTEEAVGALTGWQGLQDYGHSVAENRAKLAAAQQRPDLESGGKNASWLNPTKWGYEVAKAVPGLAGMFGAGTLAASTAPAWLPEGVAAAAASAPLWLRGAMTGEKFASHLIGGAVGAYPMAVGANVEAAKSANGGELSRGAAGAALAAGVPEAAIAGATPAALRDMDVSKIGGPGGLGLAKRLLTRAGAGATINAPQVALQTAVAQQFGPEMSMTDRAKAIVDAATGGAVVGGALGAAFHAVAKQAPDKTFNDPNKQAAAVDAVVGGPDDPTAPPPPPPAAPAGHPLDQMPEADLLAQHEDLTEKSKGLNGLPSLTPEEQTQLALAQEQLARRTMPGMEVGEGKLFSPEDLAKRDTDAAAFHEGFAKENPDIQIPDGSPLKRATSLPELINATDLAMRKADEKGSVPEYLTKTAEAVGLVDGEGKPVDFAAKVAQQDGELAKLKADGAPEDEVTKAEADLKATQDLAAAHEAAADLLPKQDEVNEAPPPVRPVPDTLKGNDDAAAKWDSLSLLAEHLQSDDPAAAGKAQELADKFAGSAGKKYQAQVDKFLAKQNGALEQARRAEDTANDNTPKPDVANDNAAGGETVANDNTPLARADEPGKFADGSTMPFMNDNVPDVPKPPTAPGITNPAAHIADIQAGHRTEALRLIDDPTTSDIDKARLQKALDQEATGQPKYNAAVTKALIKRDGDLEKAQPNGPFDSGEGQVVGTASVPHEHVSFLQAALKAAGLGDLRVALVHPDDTIAGLGDAHGLHGSYGAARQLPDILSANPDTNGLVQQFGPTSKDFMVYVRPDLDHAMTATTIGEEVGHIAKKVLYNNASDQVKSDITTAYQRDLKAANPDMKAIDFLRLFRNKAQADDAARRLDPNMKASDLPNLDYYRSFDEWFANHVSRWLTSAEKGTAPRGALEKFFASVAETYRRIAKAITGDAFLPDDTVKRFMDQASTDGARAWAADPDGSVNFSKSAGGGPEGPDDVPSMNDTVKAAATTANAMQSTLTDRLLSGTAAILPKIRNSISGLWWLPSETLQRIGSSIGLKSMDALASLQEVRQALRDKIHQVTSAATAGLFGTPQEMLAFGRLMRESALNGIDFTKAAKDQDFRGTPNEAERVKLADELYQVYNSLGRNGSNARARFDAAIAANKFQLMLPHVARQIQVMNNFDKVNPQSPIEGGARDVFDMFRTNAALHSDPVAARNHFWDALRANEAAIEAKRGEITQRAAETDAANTPPGEKIKPTDAGNAIRAEANGLDVSQRDSKAIRARLAKPYFSVGRNGDYFVSAKLVMDNGLPDQEKLGKLQEILDKHSFNNIGLSQLGDSDTFFARVENPGIAQKLANAIKEAQDAGHIAADPIQAGRPEKLESMLKMAPKDMQEFIAKLADTEMPALPLGDDGKPHASAEAYALARDKLVGDAIRTWLDMHSQNSLAKYNVERNAVHGFDNDMFGAYARRNFATASSVARQVYASQAADIHQQMAREVADAKTAQPGQPVDVSKAVRVQDYANEAMVREANVFAHTPENGWGALRQITHAVAIGMSPAYVSVVLTQIPTLVIPELAKRYGYGAATRAVAESVGDAMKITMASLRENKHFGISQETLNKSGARPDSIRDVLEQDNLGRITTNGWTRQNMDFANGATPKETKLGGWANMLGYGVETFTRIVATLAAGKLHDTDPARARMDRSDFMGSVTNGSNFKWGDASNARAAGSNGFAGPISPLMFNFMGFQTRMIGKLYTEMRAVLGKEGPEAQKEAARFLAGHLAATVAIAGTLGMPGSGMFAGVADKIGTELTGRDDFDVKAMYRGWLADTFGKDTGKMLAHGIPYAAGVDMTHAGGERLLPFTDLIANKRKFEDAWKDWATSMTGSGLGMAQSALIGARDMMNGEYMNGVGRVIPGVLHGPLNAAKLAQYGYEDSRGVKMPLTAGASDILLTAIGMKPAQKSEWDEKLKTYQGIQAERQYHEGLFTKHLDLAVGHQDPSWMADVNERGAAATRNNPGMATPYQHMGQTIANALKTPKIQEQRGMPGSASDITTQRLLGRY